MAATQVLAENMDQLDVNAVGLVKNDLPDVDEEDSADEGQDLVDTNTSTKKKKKKKPKKKVSYKVSGHVHNKLTFRKPLRILYLAPYHQKSLHLPQRAKRRDPNGKVY